MKILAPGEKLNGSHWGLSWKDGAAECPEGDLLEKLMRRGYVPASVGSAAEPEKAEAAPKKKRTKKPKEA